MNIFSKLIFSLALFGTAYAADAPKNAPLTLPADLSQARGVQIRINLTLVSRDGTSLSMYTLKHAGDYADLLHGNGTHIARTLTDNPWVSDTGAKDAQQVIYPRFQLTHALDTPDTLTAIVGEGQCRLNLKISDVTAKKQGSVHVRLTPLGDISPACSTHLPKLQEIDADIVPQAYEYYPQGSKVPAIFELNDGNFSITSNPLLTPENRKDLGIYRDTLTVQGTSIDKKPAPGVTLGQNDLLHQATLFSGFALLGQEKYLGAVKSQSYPYTFAWLDDLNQSRPYFSDGIIYRNLHGQSIQWVYYPTANGKTFTVSEMTFHQDGQLEELCRFPMNLNQVTFRHAAGEIPAIVIEYQSPDLANSTYCKGVPIASYPSSLNVTLTPEVLDPARVEAILEPARKS